MIALRITGAFMAEVAVRSEPSDDNRMVARRSKSKYAPPSASDSVMLSDALRGTGRLRDTSQLTFLPGDKAPGDLRIFAAGDLSLLKRPCVAIVGTREVSEAGIAATEWLTRKLVKSGVVIVSGLAYGVDSIAHRTAIKSGGSTIAVIGTPLNMASPSDNASLQEEIYRDHLLISQFPIGEATQPTNFPIRNRLMATLSDATVVMEARNKSGTLHQAAERTKIGRWLFIAKSVVNDPDVSWPADFLKYKTCTILERASQVTDAVLKSSQSRHTLQN